MATEADGGGGATGGCIVAVIERDALAPETLGLTLAEAKAVLAKVQAAIVADRVAAHTAASRGCSVFGMM